jgi:hypothetical protein
MPMKFLILSVSLIFVIGSALTLHLVNGLTAVLTLLLLTIAGWEFLTRPVIQIASLNARLWIVAGLLCLAGLLVPSSLLVDHPLSIQQPFGTLFDITLFILPSLGLIFVDLLIQTGIASLVESQDAVRDESARLPARSGFASKGGWFAIILGLLLLARILYNLYWLNVWDQTQDSIEFMWMILPLTTALFAALLLIEPLAQKARLVGPLYLLLIPASLIATYLFAGQVDYRQLTADRAARISQAIQAYHARQGVYPQTLGQLTPWYLLTIPSPVIINGAGWCYDGGDEYYRLGAVFRGNWWDPAITGRIYATQGKVPDLPPLCQREIIEFKNRDPGFWLRGN